MNITKAITNYVGESHEQVVPITLFIAVLCLCLVIGHLLEENRWLNESITALLLVCLSLFFFFSIYLCIYLCIYLHVS